MITRASIDLGTNTCLLLVADWNSEKNQLEKVIGDFACVVRLGEGVDKNRQLQSAAMERTLHCLKEYAAKVREFRIQPSEVLCVATSQARDAQNSTAFFSKVRDQTGFLFQVISGLEEAHYTFVGTLAPDESPEISAILDIGGGSTEVISSSGGVSVDLGAVRFTERFFHSDPVTDAEFWNCQEAIDSGLLKLSSWRKDQPHVQELIAVAGTATTLAAWHLDLPIFDRVKIEGCRLSRGDVHRMVEDLKWRTLEERKKLPCMEPMRADVLLAGALILWRTLELLQFYQCRVSTRGLRYGILSAKPQLFLQIAP